MFGVELSDVKQAAQTLIDAQVRVWAGLAFMALALAAIQYDEIIAPGVSRLSDGWNTAATDMGRRLTAFSL